MALPITYFLSDVDGALCVAARSADSVEPRYIVTHFPTVRTTAIFCREWEIDPIKLRASVKVERMMFGEYRITIVKSGFSGYTGAVKLISLKDGGNTVSVAATFEAVPVPRVGKGTKVEWQSGRWRIVPPRGKVRIVEV